MQAVALSSKPALAARPVAAASRAQRAARVARPVECRCDGGTRMAPGALWRPVSIVSYPLAICSSARTASYPA